jgi:pantoate--beta-alanine ligase
MRIIQTVKEMQAESRKLRLKGKRIGFVPTMGYLHEGHLSLVRIAKIQADVIVLSIYVNPTQFGPNEDLARYPRDFERDTKLAESEGVDYVFYPSDAEMYPGGFLTTIQVGKITEALCGASRPGHFRGVATVCTKLFNAVNPHFAVFGQKDAQQVAVIRRMVKDLLFDMEIVVGPIVREPDGLAMSSRNVYLSESERKDALALLESLKLAERTIQQGERNAAELIAGMKKHIETKSSAKIDYVSIVHPETLESVAEIADGSLIALAVWIGKTRLIDNLIVSLTAD